MYMSVCLHICMCAPCVPDARGGQERERESIGSLRPPVEMLVGLGMWVLRNKLGVYKQQVLLMLSIYWTFSEYLGQHFRQFYKMHLK